MLLYSKKFLFIELFVLLYHTAAAIVNKKSDRDCDRILAPPAGLEPATSWLTVMRSTDWAKEEYGAPSGTRTRDPLIKSQLLYQLS